MLLKTRFYLPPLRKQCVEREALIHKLENVSGGEIALVSAPAGYGKTTLVSQWLHRYPQTFCWLSLGPEHNSPALFWRYAITALQQIQPNIGVEADKLTQASAPVEQVVISLLNDLDELSVMNHSDNAIAIVLDDFHALQNAKLLRLINLFLDHLPPSIRLIITSRDEPSLSLAKRRATNQLITLGQDQLCFDKQETRQFFHNTLAIELSDSEVIELQAKTEGWVTGLQLKALSISHHPTAIKAQKSKQVLTDKSDIQTSLDRHISDYLFEEVFTTLSEEQKHFLLASAHIKRFSAGLCNSLLDRSDSLQIIDQLEKSNLFIIPLDNHRTWYRFHDLFRQFLVQQSKQIAPQNIACYTAKASQWLIDSGYQEEAIQTCVDNELWDQALHWMQQINQGSELIDTDKFAGWVSQIPTSISEKYPQILNFIDHSAPEDDGAAAIDANHSLQEPFVEPLTKREKQVLSLVSQGLSNQEIAEQLYISLNTLKVHIRNLYGKMGVETRSQAMAKAKSLNPES